VSLSIRLVWVTILVAIGLFVGFVLGKRYSGSATTLRAGAPAPTEDTKWRRFPDPDVPVRAEEMPSNAQDVAYARDDRCFWIRQDKFAIEKECQAAAGGNWSQWQSDTKRYRDALQSAVQALPLTGQKGMTPELDQQPLEGRNGFPLFELGPSEYLRHLYDPESIDKFVRDQPVSAAQRWLRARGIDLIFVPVPKMTEVYIEEFIDSCPADGIIAPHVRKAIHDMLDSDIEVLDCFPLLRRMRAPCPDYLYNAAETHWAPRGMRIVAKALADRIERYPFGRQARYALPITRSAVGPHIVDKVPGGIIEGGGWSKLTPEQQARAKPIQTTTEIQVLLSHGEMLRDDPESPVLVIGNSYAFGFVEQLVRELNLRVNRRVGGHQTTEPFDDMLREPELLKHTRVILWITTEQHMTRFRSMPLPIIAATKNAD